MAEAVAIAADTTAPAAEQVEDHDNDEDRSKRHGAPPRKIRRADEFHKPTREEQHIRPAGSSQGEPEFRDAAGKGYFGCSFSAAELMQ
jgi:hypothetical protein